MKSVNPNKWTIVFLNVTDDANICTLDSVGSIFVGIIDCIDRQRHCDVTHWCVISIVIVTIVSITPFRNQNISKCLKMCWPNDRIQIFGT